MHGVEGSMHDGQQSLSGSGSGIETNEFQMEVFPKLGKKVDLSLVIKQ